MQRLPYLDLFTNIDADAARAIIDAATVQDGEAGKIVDIRPIDYFVLLDGEANLVRQDNGKILVKLHSDSVAPPDWLYALPPGHSIKLAAAAKYVVLDGQRIDSAVDRRQETGLEAALALPNVTNETRTSVPSQTPAPPQSKPAQSENLSPSGKAPISEMKRLTDWLRRRDVFSSMSLFEVVECAASLQPFEAGKGWDVVRAGSEGNFFYLIETGEAEVWRADVENDGEPCLVATLGPGDSFGEEALLQNADRNATVRMTRAGRLWRLEKSKFDELLRDALLKQVDATEALNELDQGRSHLIDCRYATEFDMARIPGATLIPLDQLRDHIGGLDKPQRYLVYCRSGQRSKAAAFLMQRMGLDTRSIRGGLTAWPGEIEQSH